MCTKSLNDSKLAVPFNGLLRASLIEANTYGSAKRDCTIASREEDESILFSEAYSTLFIIIVGLQLFTIIIC